MANRVATPNLFAPSPPNWSLAQLDQNAQNAAGAINDSSLGATNGPLADTGAVNAYSVTCSYGTPSAYNNGMTVFFTPGNTNTGASTLTVSPLASLPIVTAGNVALSGGELIAGQTVGVVCDGSSFRIFSAQGQITAVRLRSFNAVGNPNFEITQRNCKAAISNPAHASFIEDRWQAYNNGALNPLFQVPYTSAAIPVSGTNYSITSGYMHVVSQTQKASLAATDIVGFNTNIEGPNFRELMGDVHSISILCRSSIANLKFGVALRDPGNTRSLTKLCTLGASNTITLITLPNIPIWSAGGNFSSQVGVAGYVLTVTLACGSTYISPANDTWQTGNFVGALGQDNFLATAGSPSFDCFFVQHEPGSQCTTLMDKPFAQNLDECLRYYAKSYDYGTAAGTSNSNGSVQLYTGAGVHPYINVPFKKVMAKVPAIVGLSPSTGASNNIRDWSAAVDRAISGSAIDIGQSGFSGFTLTTPNAALASQAFHWVADTGW